MNLLRLLKEKHDTRFGLTLLGATLLTGFTQLLCMMALQRTLEPAAFSQVSLVIGFFTFYVIFVDLGLQSDLVRRLAGTTGVNRGQPGQGPGEDLRGVTGLRVLGALFGLIAATASVLWNESSQAMIVALFLMMASLFPVGRLLTMEATSLAGRDLLGSLRVRTGKFFGILFITAILGLLPSKGSTLWAFALAFGGYTAIQLILVVLARQKTFAFQLEPSLAELGRSWNLIGHRGLVALTGVLFLNFQIDLHSETKLSEFNMAQSIIAPLSILIQVVVGMAASRLFVETDRRLSLKQVFLLITGVLSLHLGFLGAFSFPRLIMILFPGLSPSLFFGHLAPLTLHSFLALLSSLQLLDLQQRGQRGQSVLAGLVGLLTLLGAYACFKGVDPSASSWMICVSHALSIVAVLLMSPPRAGRRESAQQDRSPDL